MKLGTKVCSLAIGVVTLTGALALSASACPKRHAAHHVVHHKVASHKKVSHVAFHATRRPAVHTVVVTRTVYVPGPERVVYRDREDVNVAPVSFHVSRRERVVEDEGRACRPGSADYSRYRAVALREPGYYSTAFRVRTQHSYREEYRHVRYQRGYDCP